MTELNQEQTELNPVEKAFKPTYNKVAILSDPPETTTKGGLIIPLISQGQNARGTVVATGPGYYNSGTFIAPCVKVGDRVVYTKFSGVVINIEGVDINVMPDQDIIGIVTSEGINGEVKSAEISPVEKFVGEPPV